MSYKTILVCLNEIGRMLPLLNVASDIGQRQDAHIIGLYVIPAVQIYPAVGPGMSPQVLDDTRDYFRTRSEKIRSQFDEYMRKRMMRCEWRLVESTSPLIADAAIEHGREADLVVASQIDVESQAGIERDFTDRIVMETGRPVLVVPAFGDFDQCGRRALVGWNATREAARAAFDAVPLLRQCEAVQVTWVDPQKSLDPKGSLPGAELAAALARHDIKVTAEGLPTGDITEGEALLSRVSDFAADLLVLGAYGHSRLREYVFGGVTRFILKSMTVPVLMSH
jgi:nucleotide-binding universal stress UspA family protein